MDITSAEITLFQILGGSGRRVITSRGIVRASGSDEILEPGCTLQAKAGAVQNLTPWDGSSVPMGVLLEGVTAGAVAQQCRILATGPVKNEHIYIYSALLGKIKPNAGQWAILHASHIVPVGTEYAEVGAVGGTCLDGAEAPLNAHRRCARWNRLHCHRFENRLHRWSVHGSCNHRKRDDREERRCGSNLTC